MTDDELMKNANSIPPDQNPSGKCIRTIIGKYQNYYYYGPDRNGEYWYDSDITIQERKRRKEEKRKKDEEKRRSIFDKHLHRK